MGKKRACHRYTCAYIVCAIMAAPPADREIALLWFARATQGGGGSFAARAKRKSIRLRSNEKQLVEGLECLQRKVRLHVACVCHVDLSRNQCDCEEKCTR